MKIIYQLRKDKDYIEAVQRATLNTEQFGIQQTHGLFGSPEWWHKIKMGELPVQHVRGTIIKVYMGSMNDWPEFTMQSENGDASSWTRLANSRELGEHHQVGKNIEIDYVIQRHKPKSWKGESETKIVIEIKISNAA